MPQVVLVRVHMHTLPRYGYGDPLRTKVTPEFSIRLMDESYAAENKTISKVKPSQHLPSLVVVAHRLVCLS